MFASSFDYRAVAEWLGTGIRRKEGTGAETGAHRRDDVRERYLDVSEPVFLHRITESLNEFQYEIQLIGIGHGHSLP